MAIRDTVTYSAVSGTTTVRVFRGPGSGVRVEVSTGGAVPTVVTSDELSEKNRQDLVRFLMQPTLIPPHR